MSENGAKTVDPIPDPNPDRPTCLDLLDGFRQSLNRWKPNHGCKLSCAVWDKGEIRLEMLWVAPPRCRNRWFHFYVTTGLASADQSILFGFLDRNVDLFVDHFVEEETKRLLARGNRSQRADTDRFEAEQKLKGEPCPV